MYGYVGANPVNSLDQWGLKLKSIWYDEVLNNPDKYTSSSVERARRVKESDEYWDDIFYGTDHWWNFSTDFTKMAQWAVGHSDELTCSAECTFAVIADSFVADKGVEIMIKTTALALAKEGIKKGIPIYNVYSTLATGKTVISCVLNCFCNEN